MDINNIIEIFSETQSTLKPGEDRTQLKGFVTKGWVDKAEDGVERKYLEVATSGVKFDRDGDKMADTAADDIMRGHRSGTIPAFSNHGISRSSVLPFRTYMWQDVIGVWTDARRDGENVKSTLRLNMANPDADLLWRYTVEQKMPIGFSIGAIIKGKKEIEVEVE